ncbi:MAG TPA: hypothetical protein VGV87_11615 [Blastocatellia bacterium]|jgi:hypothetical protein|nr:hypothetical protein [Blastocatellia bacterium]
MQKVLIHRRGSLLYTRAYRKLAVVLTLIYLLIGAVLAVAAVYAFSHILAGVILFLIVGGFVAAVWLVYVTLLRVFAREARHTVEIGGEGVREVRDGREYAFIPWDGVKELELAATIVAGATLRVKGEFSEISISNVDLTLTRPMSLREMHRAVGQTSQMRELLESVKGAAARAPLRMNRLARRRLSKYEWVRSL